jgi:hypothetical protein
MLWREVEDLGTALAQLSALHGGGTGHLATLHGSRPGEASQHAQITVSVSDRVHAQERTHGLCLKVVRFTDCPSSSSAYSY